MVVWQGDSPAVKEGISPNVAFTGFSWAGADAYCAWLSTCDQSGAYRMPCEDEWEYACRAQTQTRFHFGTEYPERFAVFEEYTEAQVVGSRLPNPWGLFDMTGNATEWCCLSPDRVTTHWAVELKPHCGGDFSGSFSTLESSYRWLNRPDEPHGGAGLRLVYEPEKPEADSPSSGKQ